MSTESWIDITVAIVAVILIGVAALVETSLTVVNRVTLRALLEERTSPQRGVQSLVDQPHAVRSAMLLIELLGASMLGIATTRLFNRELAIDGTLMAVAVSVVALVFVGRVFPALVVSGDQADVPRRYQGLATVLSTLARPVVIVADMLIRAGNVLLRRNNRRQELELSDIEHENGEENGSVDQEELEEDEHEMISAILQLDEAHAREIMVPRPDIVAVPIETSVLDVVETARQAGHSRIPVYRDSIDSIVGVVYAKDFLRFVQEDLENVEIAELLRPAYYVPESKRVDELLKDLRKEKTHLAIVVDEYGGTSGIVTIEDILEEIVGEIQDEYDTEAPLVEQVGPGEAIVDGRLSVDDVADIFDTRFAEGEFDTIGGFVQRQLGRIPNEGESVRSAGLLFEVLSVQHRRIRKLRVVRVAEEEDQPVAAEEEARAG